jgi:1-acyl-sn-glycerol-3-phosphate acyltransferase
MEGDGERAARAGDVIDASAEALPVAVEALPRPPVGVLDWILTLPFLLAFGATLLVFDVLQRLARLLGQRPHEAVVGALQVCLLGSLRLCGTRLSVERDPAVAPRTPYILIANHQSMFDIPILGALLFSNYPKYVSKRELARWIPSISFNLRRGGNGLIDRGDRAQAEAEIRALGRRAQARGVSVVIYPEGTRARAGALAPFKPRGTLALLAAAPDLAVVPVAIDGSWKLLSHNLLPVPCGVRVRVRFLAPIERDGTGADAEVFARAEAAIAQALGTWRSGSGAPS